MLGTKSIALKTALLFSSKGFDSAAAGGLVESSKTKTITSADEMRGLPLTTLFPCETKFDSSLLVYAWGISFAIDISKSYGFAILT
jgi:hypothetical protein